MESLTDPKVAGTILALLSLTVCFSLTSFNTRSTGKRRRYGGHLAPINKRTARRRRTVEALYQRLDRYRFVLVRGTPASGKSTLAQLLWEYMTEELRLKPLIVGMWRKDGQRWMTKLEAAGYARNQSNIIIMDEAQLTYWDTDFWNSFLKSITSDSKDRVILFASYGSPSPRPSVDGTNMFIQMQQQVSLRPVDHGDTIPAAGLFLLEDEFQDMVKRSHPCHRFNTDFLDYAFRITAGHAGAVYSVLRIVVNHDSYCSLKQHDATYSLETFWSQFPIAEFWDQLETSAPVFRRGLPEFYELKLPAIARVFRAVLRNINVCDGTFHSKKDKAALQDCFRFGWLHSTMDQEEIVPVYIFTTPLHRWFIDYYLGTMASKDTVIAEKSLFEFAINVIRKFSHRQLSSRKVGTSSLQRSHGVQVQDEFYRSCHQYYNGSLVYFPDASERIDFYIPSKKWGVMLLCDGDGLEQHSSRFTGPAAYAKMEFKDHIILDFRSGEPERAHPEMEKFYHVVMEAKDTYTKTRIVAAATLRDVTKPFRITG